MSNTARAVPTSKLLQLISDGTASTIGNEFFSALVRSTAGALRARYAFVSEFTHSKQRVRTLSFWAGQDFADNVEYDLAGTPCEAVLKGELRFYPKGVQALFPLDGNLVKLHAESFLAIPLTNKSGDVLGHLAVLDDKPMHSEEGTLSILRILGARAAAELERKRVEEELLRSERRFANILASARDVIVIIDDARRIHLFNRAAERVFRCKAEWAMGQSFDRLLSSRFRKLLEEYVQAFVSPDTKERSLWVPDGLTALRADGEEFPIEVTVSPLEAAGQRLHTVILRDLNERRQAEEALRKARQENLYLQEEINRHHGLGEPIGESPPMQALLADAGMVAATDATVLLYGETGTGKDLIATCIHRLSSRRDKLLIKVNCAALPSELIESELFGHEKGAFTGATAQRKGRFELADGGTIFLDEVGELTPSAQAKLLRVLQEQAFERVGGSKTLRVDVRVIAATNRELQEMVDAGTYRADLFYRLNVFPLRVPPLRAHRADIPLLVSHFLGQLSRKLGKRLDQLSVDSTERLIEYAWPGNVRELQNVIERAAILCPGPLIHIKDALTSPIADPTAASGTLEDVERRHILQILKDCRWTIEGQRGAAVALGLKPSTLRFRMRKLGITKPVKPGVRTSSPSN